MELTLTKNTLTSITFKKPLLTATLDLSKNLGNPRGNQLPQMCGKVVEREEWDRGNL